MSLLDALDLDIDTDYIEFYDVRCVNDKLSNNYIGIRGYIKHGEESCHGKTYRIPLYDNIDHRKSIVIYVSIDFIDKLYNYCDDDNCEDCWWHDGTKSVCGIGYYKKYHRDYDTPVCSIPGIIHLDTIEPIYTNDTVDIIDVRYLNDEHLHKCIGIRGYIIIGEELQFDQKYCKMPIYDNMDPRKSTNILVAIDYIKSYYRTKSLIWIDNKDRLPIFGVGYLYTSHLLLNTIEMTKSDITSV